MLARNAIVPDLRELLGIGGVSQSQTVNPSGPKSGCEMCVAPSHLRCRDRCVLLPAPWVPGPMCVAPSHLRCRGLRCVLLPAPWVPGVPTKIRLEYTSGSMNKVSNPNFILLLLIPSGAGRAGCGCGCGVQHRLCADTQGRRKDCQRAARKSQITISRGFSKWRQIS